MYYFAAYVYCASKAIELRQPFDYGGGHSAALEDLQGAIAYLKQQNKPEWRDLLRSLRALANNLSALDHLLRDAANPDAIALTANDAILDRDPKTFKEAFERIRQNLSIHSLLFRHALRLSIAVAAGYGVMQMLHADQGYCLITVPLAPASLSVLLALF